MPNSWTHCGDEENLWFQDALKHSILELILPEKTLKVIKSVLFKIYLIAFEFGCGDYCT